MTRRTLLVMATTAQQPSIEENFVSAVMMLLALLAYAKRRIVVEWQMRHWMSHDDTAAWNLAHHLISPPFLLRGFDVTRTFAPNVPHRRVADYNFSTVPSDAYLPREVMDYLDGAAAVRGPPSSQVVSGYDGVAKLFAKRGEWKTVLAAVELVQRRTGRVSADDANTAVLSLLDAHRRHFAVKELLETYKHVPFPPSTYARFLRECASEQHLVGHIIEKMGRERIPLSGDVLCSALTAISAADWEAAVRCYAAAVPRNTDAPEPTGLFQQFALNLTQSTNLPEKILVAVLEDIKNRWHPEYVPTLTTILHTALGARVAAAELEGKSGSFASWELSLALASRCLSVPTAVAVIHHIVRHAPLRHAHVEHLINRFDKSCDIDATLKACARAITAQGHWQLAAGLARIGVKRRACDAVPALTYAVARQGQWNHALRLCSQAFTLRRMPPTAPELGLCVHASVMAGRWSAALFWIERAHARGMRFSPAVYDAAFSATSNTKWQASLRAYIGMSEVGGLCTETGVRAFVSGAATQHRAEAALEVIALSNTVIWER